VTQFIIIRPEDENSVHKTRQAVTHQKRIVIAIDGLAGTGKSTLARLIAERLGFQHLNTGLIYRAVAFIMAERGLSIAQDQALVAAIQQTGIRIVRDDVGRPQVRLQDGRSFYYEDLLAEEVSKHASQVAAHESVRAALLELQREAYPGLPLVAEGRDMGTVVFPDAQVKFFIEVPASIRAARRLAQLREQGEFCDVADEDAKKHIESEILERDTRDQQRAIAPCIPAHDAVLFDNSKLSLTQAVTELYHRASARLTKPAS
jgi:cytidylate kinase